MHDARANYVAIVDVIPILPNVSIAHCIADRRRQAKHRVHDVIKHFPASIAFTVPPPRISEDVTENLPDEVNNGIDNLVLLDYATNRSYKNSVFAVKRYRILSLDRHGIFVPLCTRNVFLKSYNPRVEHMMFWTEDDSDGYRQVMIDTLHKLFIGGPPHD